MKFGYDLYEVASDDIVSLLNSFKKDHLIVFQLTKIDDNTYRFYLPIYQRFLARKYNMQIIKSVLNSIKKYQQKLNKLNRQIGFKNKNAVALKIATSKIAKVQKIFLSFLVNLLIIIPLPIIFFS